MTKATDVLVLFDRSGSMLNIVDEAVGAVNGFFDEQRNSEIEGEVYVTLASFDTSYDVLFDKKPLPYLGNLTVDMVRPRGMTALNDSIAKLIHSKEDNENKTVLLVMTDGFENSSIEYSPDAIKKLVSQKEIEGWDVNFIGAGLSKQDVDTMTTHLGFTKGASFDKSQEGMKEYQTYMSVTTNSVRMDQ